MRKPLSALFTMRSGTENEKDNNKRGRLYGMRFMPCLLPDGTLEIKGYHKGVEKRKSAAITACAYREKGRPVLLSAVP